MTRLLRDHPQVMKDADSVLTCLDRVDRAAQQLHSALGVLHDRTCVTRRLSEHGRSLGEALARSPEPACHEAVAVQMADLAEAVHEYRCAIVRHLVDVEGWSLSDVAASTGNARQVVSRLYHASERPRHGCCPRPKLQIHDLADSRGPRANRA